ncbi:putative S-adenosyl-L-methionine-binding protein [Geobacter sp. OR-1]|uniref:FmdE family protein n=1 Tax=Geobacter sp. OR-1 TaxID=1266765 RepID=UPI0005422827|nr:FmdE family protein [Geobacter sp. OR-1]GAM10920.1 putative S-adenosyl-L-methionine-binding protein [Geobacter sp. OR-1]
MDYSDIVAFHGHQCPGLAIGYRLASAAMAALNVTRAGDEELVAIVENDACGVDALQCLTGCTFGKGNLIFRDYGKQVYTVYSRKTGTGVRVVYHDDGVPPECRDDRQKREEFIRNGPQDAIISLSFVEIDEPETARKRKSVNCAICGEPVMETRLRDTDAGLICIPCAEQIRA